MIRARKMTGAPAPAAPLAADPVPDTRIPPANRIVASAAMLNLVRAYPTRIRLAFRSRYAARASTVTKYPTTIAIRSRLPRVPMASAATATRNRASTPLASVVETGTKWRASRSVRYGCSMSATADSEVIPRGRAGHRARATAAENRTTTDPNTRTRSRWTGRGSRRYRTRTTMKMAMNASWMAMLTASTSPSGSWSTGHRDHVESRPRGDDRPAFGRYRAIA